MSANWARDIASSSEPVFSVGPWNFYGWHVNPDGRLCGIFANAMFGTGGALDLEALKSAASGNVMALLEADRKAGIKLATQAVDMYPN